MVEPLLSNIPLLLFTAGLVLMVLEALSPGAHLVVIGVALAGAGLIGLLVPGGLDVLVLAGLTLAIGALAAYVYREFDFYGGKGTAQTKDSSSLAGSTGYATETITTRGGEVKLEGGGFTPFYSARTTSGTIEEGEEIIVLDPGGGNVLTVEAIGSIEADEIDRALARESDADGSDDTGTDTDSTAIEADDTEIAGREPVDETTDDTTGDDDTDDSITETESN
ncbi:NfeD family protein [Halostagnicola kamekurae]|uniref:Membrane protein implicated in regulation of membrane protease activity n=1 Tax=Halostagnicola kamekurae TaxID=619731 RepID=A0A1I6RXC0_9EURY|nr:NfeD family protein [Halostagnicola kamekurae]SFS69240.1 Membrane protein implicated in regulation of membrane protease activity [Halostagnicola kamekurae]